MFQFLNVKIEKRINQQVTSYYFYKLHSLLELRVTNLCYLLKDKKDKKVYTTVSIRVCNKHILFWQGKEGVCIPLRGIFYFVEILTEIKQTMKLEFILTHENRINSFTTEADII